MGQVGVTAYRACCGAGRIEQNGVICAFMSECIFAEECRSKLGARQVFAHARKAALGGVKRCDGGARGGELHGFATRCAAHVEHFFAHLGFEQSRGECGGSVLNPPLACLKACKRRHLSCILEADGAKGRERPAKFFGPCGGVGFDRDIEWRACEVSEFDLTHDFGGISLCQGAAQPLGQAWRAQDLDLFDSLSRDFAQDGVGQPFHGAIFLVFAKEGHGFIDDAMGITALGEFDCGEAQKIHHIGGGFFA